MSVRLTASTLALLLLSPLHAAADAPRKAGEIVTEPATMMVSATEKIEYELGTLYVPENRSDPASRIIGVGFARFKAEPATSAPPTFHLPGGPGSSFIESLSGNAGKFILRFRPVGDVVVMDQRGFSRRGDILRFSYRTPEEPLDQPAALARHAEEYLKLSREAIDAYQKKEIDLRGYTAKECAEDVNDLRKALGYDTISLVGTSFGSQWSFSLMRLHPEIVARAILSGVEPINNGYDMPSGVLGAYKRCWQVAEKDKAIAPYVPAGGIEAAATAVIERLEKAPVKVEVKDRRSGETVTVTLGKEDFQQQFNCGAAANPAWILSLYREHYDAWAATVLTRRHSRADSLRMVGPLIDTSLGVTPAREKQLRNDPATAYLGQWNWTAYIASKDVWPTADVGDDFRTPVRTEIPVIFANGDWDTSTPVENTYEIAKFFPKSRIIIGERGGHGILEPLAGSQPKVWAQMMDFLRTGTMPDLPARVMLGGPKFAVPDFPPPAAK